MTTLQAEILLMNFFGVQKNTIVPAVTQGTLLNFESDIVVLSKSRYATVIEIKVSLQDLRKDLKKAHIRSCEDPFKLNRYFGQVKYFYYAVPYELAQKAIEQIPEFAGLIILDKRGPSIIREPKKLFSTKWTAAQELKLARLGAMRVLNLKSNILKLRK